VAYTDLNVMDDTEARAELLARTGQMAVPVTVIGDDVVVGFDRARLSQLLGL
jgi:glutaredoxin